MAKAQLWEEGFYGVFTKGDNHTAIAGGKVHFYVPGGTVDKDAFDDADKSNVIANPFTLDGNGEATIYLDGPYKIVVNDSLDTSTIRTMPEQSFQVDVFTTLSISSALLLPDGTVSAPGLSFTDDTNTGLYRIGSGNVGFSSDGTLIFDYDSTGLNVIAGSESNPSYSILTDSDTGFYHATSGNFAYTSNGTKIIDFTETGLVHAKSQIYNTNTTAKTGAYTVITSDHIVRLDPSGGAFIVDLPTAVGVAGQEYVFKNIDAGFTNVATIDGDGSETIDGHISVELGAFGYLTVLSNGTNWEIVKYDSGWIDWTPSLNAGTMTTTSIVTDYAQYRRHGTGYTVDIRYGASLTLGGTPTNNIAVSGLTHGLSSTIGIRSIFQGSTFNGSATIVNAFAFLTGSGDKIFEVRKFDNSNYTAASGSEIYASGSYQIDATT